MNEYLSGLQPRYVKWTDQVRPYGYTRSRWWWRWWWLTLNIFGKIHNSEALSEDHAHYTVMGFCRLVQKFLFTGKWTVSQETNLFTNYAQRGWHYLHIGELIGIIISSVIHTVDSFFKVILGLVFFLLHHVIQVTIFLIPCSYLLQLRWNTAIFAFCKDDRCDYGSTQTTFYR